ncbi:hypothetical protein PsAD37_03211 [Pseudovibrio sp. Ad37]|nr:hypothetical protein PsAD37_03211 [Pseudovibrio sp. Ad37]
MQQGLIQWECSALAEIANKDSSQEHFNEGLSIIRAALDTYKQPYTGTNNNTSELLDLIENYSSIDFALGMRWADTLIRMHNKIVRESLHTQRYEDYLVNIVSRASDYYEKRDCSALQETK